MTNPNPHDAPLSTPTDAANPPGTDASVPAPAQAPWSHLVERNLPLVKYVLGRLSRNLPPVVDRDDLHSAGLLGLLEAARRYDPSRNVPFHSYAIPRIWGAMLDELRSHDRLSPDMREKVSHLKACQTQMNVETGTEPSTQDLADRMGCSLEQVVRVMRMAKAGRCYAASETDGSESGEQALYTRRNADAPRGPYEQAELQDQKEGLARCILALPPREREVVMLRYHEGLYLHEIGKVLDISESRVCQIHSQALRRLRRALKSVGVLDL